MAAPIKYGLGLASRILSSANLPTVIHPRCTAGVVPASTCYQPTGGSRRQYGCSAGLKPVLKLNRHITCPTDLKAAQSAPLECSSLTDVCQRVVPTFSMCARPFHTSAGLGKFDGTMPSKWLKYNEIVYPPKAENEPMRPADINHQKVFIKYQFDKMWYLATMIRGMSIDEALKQLSFRNRKGASIMKETLLEAQEMAVQEHNVEYKSNLWIAESFVRRGTCIKGMRKHRGPRFGVVHYNYIHYFIKLREGKPPKHYYPPPPTGEQLASEYVQRLRSRKIVHGL